MSGSERGADPSPVALAAAVVAALRDRSQTLATAESLTGGLVGATLTDVPGASAVYRGGLIVYATGLKAALARVSAQTLATDGPVAASTAAELARGAAAACGADWGLATTGVAGPDPQDGHPVGQVFVAVAGPRLDGATDGLPEGRHDGRRQGYPRGVRVDLRPAHPGLVVACRRSLTASRT
jgi:nicotinamide-nucleotide amidase